MVHLAVVAVILVVICLSACRVACLRDYQASQEIYVHFLMDVDFGRDDAYPVAGTSMLIFYGDGAFQHGLVVNLCVGKEWYRYPSSFVLPSER